jgi:hypothetical protein
VRIHRPDADLDQPAGQSLLHDPGERTCVGEAVALEFIVEIGMSVDVQDGKR